MAKYNVGDRLKYTPDDTGVLEYVTVVEVYPGNVWFAETTYKVEFVFVGGNVFATVSESYLQEAITPYKNTSCDCGCHLIYGHENCHSYWCTAHKSNS